MKEACDLLGLQPQELVALRDSGDLLGVEGKTTVWFPVWQIDRHTESVRPVAEDIISAFAEHLGLVDALQIASWATSRQAADLDGQTPAQWITAGQPTEHVTESARRAASRLAW